MTFDLTKISFRSDFKPSEMVVLHDDGRSPICAFRGTVGGKDLFHVRSIYEQYGEWCPGKGISVPYDKKKQFLESLLTYCDEELPKLGGAATFT